MSAENQHQPLDIYRSFVPAQSSVSLTGALATQPSPLISRATTSVSAGPPRVVFAVRWQLGGVDHEERVDPVVASEDLQYAVRPAATTRQWNFQRIWRRWARHAAADILLKGTVRKDGVQPPLRTSARCVEHVLHSRQYAATAQPAD